MVFPGENIATILSGSICAAEKKLFSARALLVLRRSAGGRIAKRTHGSERLIFHVLTFHVFKAPDPRGPARDPPCPNPSGTSYFRALRAKRAHFIRVHPRFLLPHLQNEPN